MFNRAFAQVTLKTEPCFRWRFCQSSERFFVERALAQPGWRDAYSVWSTVSAKRAFSATSIFRRIHSTRNMTSSPASVSPGPTWLLPAQHCIHGHMKHWVALCKDSGDVALMVASLSAQIAGFLWLLVAWGAPAFA